MGHKPSTQQLSLKRGDKENLALRPEPILSSLQVVSEPIDAEIYLNGKLVGTTPHILRNLLVGGYEIELRLKGYATEIRMIEVKEGEVVEVVETLRKGFEFEPEMVFVEGGTFTMGCTSEQSDCGINEKPTHRVTLSSFQMGKYEVTQAQWRAVMGSNPSHFSGCDDCPVENVGWKDVQEFIRKLNQKTGKNYRLPTEAEWEFAARGGNKSKGYKYAGGNNIGSVAWYGSNSGSKTHPVGQKQANDLGIYDMTGNVLEWCSDWYGNYSSSSQTNPKGPQNGSIRVLRGGSWGNLTWVCRVAVRVRSLPSYRGRNSGFRIKKI
jgi:formylglycine-generating enzyme required for sulfatase activity